MLFVQFANEDVETSDQQNDVPQELQQKEKDRHNFVEKTILDKEQEKEINGN